MWQVVGELSAFVAAVPGVWLLYVGRRERLRGQAEQVTAWSVREVRSNEGGRETPPSGVVVVNTSSSEVRDVAVKVLSREGDDIVGKRYNAIAPGSYYLKYDNGTWSAPSALSAEGGYLSSANFDASSGEVDTITMLPITEVPPMQWVALLRFRTSNGRRWVRLDGGEIEPEYLVESRSGPRNGLSAQRLSRSVGRWWRRRWNQQLRDDLTAVKSVISKWDQEFERTQGQAASLPEFAPRVSAESNRVAALLRRSLVPLVAPSESAEREQLLSRIPDPEDRHQLKRVTVSISKNPVLPPTIVAARASGSPGRALTFLTNIQTPNSNVYYLQAAITGPLLSEFFYGDLRQGFKKCNVDLRKMFVKEAEASGRPGGGTVETWREYEVELMATIGAVITAHAQMPVSP